MICLADTDIILKLAVCDLLPQTLEVLDVLPQEVYVFKEEALRVYQYDLDVIDQYSEEERKRAVQFVKRVRGLYSEIDPDEQNYMQAAGIDTGEQAIFGATRDSMEFQVVTADRNALRKLAHAPLCGDICARMRGRVRSLDQIVLLLVQRYGYETIRIQIEPHIAHDIVYEEAFKAGISSEDAATSLGQRIRNLRAATLGLLAP